MLDAAGCAVTPGFIDIHTHYDAQVFWDPALRPSSFHGVTTVVAGNCGFSIAPTRAEHHDLIVGTLENVEDMNPATLTAGIAWEFATFAEYLDLVRSRGTLINFTAYIGHSAVRLWVMGDAAYERAATPDEIEQMCTLVRDALAAGAAGFSTSFSFAHRGVDGKPVPSRFADAAEVEALFLAVGEAGTGVVLITPGEQCSYADVYAWQPRDRSPVHVPAVRGAGRAPSRARPPARRGFGARRERVAPGHSPPPHHAVHDGRRVQPQHRPGLRRTDEGGSIGTDGGVPRSGVEGASRGRPRGITDAAPVGHVRDLRVGEVPRARGPARRRRRPRAGLQSARRDVRDRGRGRSHDPFPRAYIANDDVDEVGRLLVHDHVILGLSDAGAHVDQLCDAPLPTDLLGTWVRDRGAISLEHAVRKLTGEPADMFGFVGRGYLREGYAADVCVFDPITVGTGPTRRVRDFPADAERLTAEEPTGMRHTLVNGTPIRIDGVQVESDARPGTRPRIK